MDKNDHYKRKIEECEKWLDGQMKFLETLPVSDKLREEMRANISSTMKTLAAMKDEMPPSPPRLPVYVVSAEGEGMIFKHTVGAYMRRDKAVEAASNYMQDLVTKEPKKGAFELLDDDDFDDPTLEVWYREAIGTPEYGTRVSIQQYQVEP